MTGGAGNDLFKINDPGTKTIFDFNTLIGENDRIDLSAFLKSIADIKTLAHLVEIGGVESTRIDYLEREGSQSTLTVIGYNYQTDPNFVDHFVV